MSSILVDLENIWSSHSHRGKNLYLYWAKKPNSQNHGHVFYHKDHKKWYYNIKCNNNKGNDRIRHNITKIRAKTLKNKIKKIGEPNVLNLYVQFQKVGNLKRSKRNNHLRFVLRFFFLLRFVFLYPPN